MFAATPGILKGPKRVFKQKLIHRFVDDFEENFSNEIALIYEGIFDNISTQIF
jgi:hypothetical protein